MNSIKIVEAAPFSEDVSVIARWLSENWGLGKGFSLSETEDWCNDLASAQSETLFVGRRDNQILGTIIVCECDLEGYEHLTPWISSLYVPQALRGNDIGKQLANAACDWAREQGHRDLYLYAEMGRLIPYYRSLGWRSIEDFQIDGDAFQIMRKSIAGSE